ncbi:MAG TPA: M56 family metallopeptidase [Candidatus Acidoferrales bacterium]
MTPHSFALSSSSFLTHIIDPALRSLALGTVAAILLYAFRVKNPSARLIVWKGVLYAALAMPVLALAVPSLSVPLPSSVAALFAKTRAASAAPAIAILSATKPTGLTVSAMPTAGIDQPSAATFSEPKIIAEPQSSMTQPKADPRANRAARHAVIAPQSMVYPKIEAAATTPTALTPPDAHTPPHLAFSWHLAAASVFCVVALFLLARIALGAILGHRLARSAETIGDASAIRVLIRQARAAGVVSAPRLAECDLVSVPVTLGVFRPIIIVPSYWQKWDEPTLRAVIAHEMSHVARHDALTQRLALIHRAIFWFSPLAWWLDRALADAAEEASDEAVLIAGADQAFYAETLLGFFAALSENTRRVYWQGVSMAAPGQADRRVDRILNWKGAVSMRIRKSLAVGLAVVGVPVILFAAAARPTTQAVSPVAPPAPVAPSLPANPQAFPAPDAVPNAIAEPAPAIPMPPVDATPFLGQVEPAPPPAPVIAQAPDVPEVPPAIDAVPAPPNAPYIVVTPNISISDRATKLEIKRFDDFPKQMAFQINAMPQLSPEDQQKLRELEDRLKNLQSRYTENSPEIQKLQQEIAQATSHLDMQIQQMVADGRFQYQVGPMTNFSFGDDSDRFVIVSDDSPIIMSGNSQDVEHATELRNSIKGDFIWFQHDEKSYIIRDQNLVNQAKGFFKPEEDLGQKQQALGKQQQALGDQQRALGDKMREIHVTVPDLSADMEKLEAQMKQLSASGGTQQQLGDLQRQLGELMRKLGQNQNQAGDQQRQIGEQMRALGDQQRTLGDQQRDLGHQQRDAAQQARQQMKQLLDDAVSKGTAQPE